MPHDIRPTAEADLPELSRFLAEGFRTPSDAPFAATDVLRWKYFDPRGDEAGDAPRSYLARHETTGRVVGHLGVCRGKFHGSGSGLPPEGLSTLHMIDWLSSQAGAGVGASLMRRAHEASVTQYGFGGSAAGRGVGGGAGYGLVSLVPVLQRVLRPSHRFKDVGHGFAGRALRMAKDVATRVRKPPKPPRTSVEIEHVAAFGAEIAPILNTYESRAIFTTRSADLLNHFLRFPRGGLSGWRIKSGGAIRGLGLLAVVPRPGGVRLGRIGECLLDDPADRDLWHAAIFALTDILKREGADLAIACATTPWSSLALNASGFSPAHDLEFRLRDRSRRIPRDATFHLTFLEADYAYL